MSAPPIPTHLPDSFKSHGGMAFADLDDRQLQWYAEECSRTDVQIGAQREQARRRDKNALQRIKRAPTQPPHRRIINHLWLRYVSRLRGDMSAEQCEQCREQGQEWADEMGWLWDESDGSITDREWSRELLEGTLRRWDAITGRRVRLADLIGGSQKGHIFDWLKLEVK